MTDRLLDEKEAAEVLRTTVPTLRRWRRQGALPFVRLGRKVFFKKPDLQAFIDANTVDLRRKSSRQRVARPR